MAAGTEGINLNAAPILNGNEEIGQAGATVEDLLKEQTLLKQRVQALEDALRTPKQSETSSRMQHMAAASAIPLINSGKILVALGLACTFFGLALEYISKKPQCTSLISG
ncbi:uncharacterized protein LOC126656409 [Mercurialis annua]|uniref:uncharacterized protein LOC126656409 n=1 Tax=Mercurialis annua TaxID=3986 RepID=UPI00215F1F66|nr:uncharacterized protein LOC126656409 [Mercurialis annua]